MPDLPEEVDEQADEHDSEDESDPEDGPQPGWCLSPRHCCQPVIFLLPDRFRHPDASRRHGPDRSTLHLVSSAWHPVESERLRLLPSDEAYSDRFADLCADPVAMSFISRGRPLPRGVVDEILARTQRMWSEHGFGPWAVLEKATGRWIGRIGLNLLADWPGRDKWEIGYELIPAAWGNGYATEGARRAIRFAWEETPLERIVSVTVPDHLASRRVMEKAGMTLRGEVDWRGTTVVWYAIDRSPSQRECGDL